MTRQPLPLPLEDWRSRWLYKGPRPSRIHRISEIEWGSGSQWGEPDEKIDGEGVAVCGVRGYWHMPGILSRMGLKRCERCCKALGIPQGNGAPFNGDAEWQDA